MNYIFLPQSGNLGDTCNILPVLSGLYKKTGEKIHLVVRDKMKNFKGFKQLMEDQECVASLKFESNKTSKSYTSVYLSNSFENSLYRPWETCRYETYLRNSFDFDVDDDFILNVPDVEVKISNNYIIGDRTYSKDADTRRSFDVLKDSNKFPVNKCQYLNYTEELITNLNIIKKNPKPFITTFTGIAVLADLMLKETMIFYPRELSLWDNKPIEYSFNQHFYRNRRCELISLDDM